MLRMISILLALALAGCGFDGPSQATVEDLAATPYPAEAEYGPDLDIVLVRRGRTLKLINREAEAFEDKLLWLNRKYVGYADRIEIGTGNRLDLDRFINQYQEPFPRAMLFRPDRDRPVVLAELYDPLTQLKNRITVQSAE